MLYRCWGGVNFVEANSAFNEAALFNEAEVAVVVVSTVVVFKRVAAFEKP
jgi:hypothetical protein